MSSPSAFPSDAFRRAAWTAVAVLWVVAMLNYLDRLVLVSMRESIVADVPMNDKAFGLLTSVFLWSYGLFSPLGGFMADKLGKKWVIFGSLMVWSAVTWATGHCHTLNQLLIARALMGISEACYIPAALALITDYHRGPTRSLAAGIHSSGIYVGAALGGIGGVMADSLGWRMGFTIFGFVGLIYGAVVFFFLHDAPAQTTANEPKPAPIRVGDAINALFREKSFYLLLLIFIFSSMANWLIYSWTPTLFREVFQMTQAKAGIYSTAPFQIASFVAVLAGGIWADRWSRKNNRARTYVTAIGFAAAAPALFIAGGTPVFSLALSGLIVYGVGRGFFDANLMPILRQVINERYSATGYGLLNFVGNAVGGLMPLAGGALRDNKVPLSIVFQYVSVGILIAAIMLYFLRQKSRPVVADTVPENA